MVRKAVQWEPERRERTAEGFDGGRSWRDISTKPGSDGLDRKKINRGVQKRTSCATLLCPKCGLLTERSERALFRECEGPEQTLFGFRIIAGAVALEGTRNGISARRNHADGVSTG